MTGYLLDTNVLSERRRRSPSPIVVAWLEAAPEEQLWLSVLTLGEIRYGIELLAARDPRAAETFETWLGELVDLLADRILTVDSAVTTAWARLRARRPLPAVDGLIGATAVAHDLTLVTRNTRDFAGLGIRLLNPFESAATD